MDFTSVGEYEDPSDAEDRVSIHPFPVSDLPDYLDDELEKTVFTHTMSVLDVVDLMSGFMDPPDDPLIETEGIATRARRAVDNALRRVSPQALNAVTQARKILDEPDVPAARMIIGHMLREPHNMVRGAWWGMICFIDQDARSLRDEARRTVKDARDASTSTQIDYLSRILALTSEEKKLWKETSRLPADAHHGKLADEGRMTPTIIDRLSRQLTLLERIVIAAEETYGLAMLFAMKLADTADPSTKETKNLLGDAFPAHPALRRWFLYQIQNGAWIGPLWEVGKFLDDAKPIDRALSRGSVSCGARTVAHFSAGIKDRDLLTSLYEYWSSIDNPSVHTDMIEVMLRSPLGPDRQFWQPLVQLMQDDRLHASTTRFLGCGLLRFPSHCLRLADRLAADGNTDDSDQVLTAVAKSLYHWHDDEHFCEQAYYALLGAGGAAEFIKQRFVRLCQKEAQR